MLISLRFLSDRSVRGGVAIQRDNPRSSMLLRCPGKEPLSGCNVTPFAQEKVDGSTLLIDGAIQVDPLASDFGMCCNFVVEPKGGSMIGNSVRRREQTENEAVH